MKHVGLSAVLLSAISAIAYATAAERDPGHFAELSHVPSSVGAKTAILVPELHRLYIAVSPGEGKSGGGIIWFDVKSVPAS